MLHRQGQQSGQPRICSRRRIPLAGRLRVQAIEQTRTPRSVTALDLFEDEPRVLQYREMFVPDYG